MFRKMILVLISLIMTAPIFSQNPTAMDKINTSAGDVEMYFIGHGSLMFKVNNYCIYVDPVRSSGSYKNLPQADLILVTHEHYDHLDPDLIRDLRKPETIMLCNANTSSQIRWAQSMKAGDKKVVNDITIEAVPAYNMVNMRSPGQPFHPKGVGNGYIITMGNRNIYVAGDTENTPEMKSLKDIYVAFLPMNLPYTMTPEMVADAVMSFKPQILYPYHYGETITDKLIQLLKNTNIEVRIRNLK
ncbi:MAG: MBL fold metallo-hydrolase [Bacteroidales bacterium]|jgi:L-ascorbate metabolism protein UlaG (beta-lactamase superfamily)|nr:MBL fold metallo-hydrolase [Bacteroidales bacterium]NMD02619.1 MBL fold metallo-hydrolase [Bacteroidales bacterium]OQB64856.1 MAG: metal-dependent hydrolase [Bacteroidetes bacterium ADurb.Bin145]